jgi:hypothetical protein
MGEHDLHIVNTGPDLFLTCADELRLYENESSMAGRNERLKSLGSG